MLRVLDGRFYGEWKVGAPVCRRFDPASGFLERFSHLRVRLSAKGAESLPNGGKDPSPANLAECGGGGKANGSFGVDQ